MSSFEIFLKMGFEHILNKDALDHIAFIVALCAAYKVSQWKNILILVTAFTIGHSITLLLATFQLILIPREIIEFLIPVTIIFTSFDNIFQPPEEIVSKRIRVNYSIALFFGFIHGMAFSGELQMLLGKSESIVAELLAFNIGIELGQIIIVAAIFLSAYLILNKLKAPHREWNIFLSGAATGIALIVILGMDYVLVNILVSVLAVGGAYMLNKIRI